MQRLYLIRHGKIADSKDSDPQLSDRGRSQADAVASALAPKGPLPIFTSPSRRARETAAPLARLWAVIPHVDARLGELPPLPDSTFRSHSEWLEYARRRRWPEMHESLRRWRDQVIEALLEIESDAVVVSHSIAINAAVSHAVHDDRVGYFDPDNCSCTTVDSDGKTLRLVELGT
ncbi:MAG TPA: histidine phosphatase family protein [Terriglobales bacterium]|nr:histidine phosphatase family protein [Terriglobales bacterium]